jgi:translation elongation factor EF-4
MIAMDDLETLRARIADSGILASAIRIGLVAVPAWEVVDVVIQDEFTHDVVMTAPGVDAALVLDCT